MTSVPGKYPLSWIHISKFGSISVTFLNVEEDDAGVRMTNLNIPV